MTISEIKSLYSLEDVARQYGLIIGRSKKIKCPFHSGDKIPSLHLYDDHFYCFGCGAHGDVIDFVSRLEGIGFKEAFLRLGGSYPSDSAKISNEIRLAKRNQLSALILTSFKKAELRHVCDEISRLHSIPDSEEPFSETWCQLQKSIMDLRRIEDEWSEKH